MCERNETYGKNSNREERQDRPNGRFNISISSRNITSSLNRRGTAGMPTRTNPLP